MTMTKNSARASYQQLGIDISTQVSQVLAEDLGIDWPSSIDINRDITAMLISADKQAQASIIAREPGILCGQAWVDEVFAQVGNCQLTWHYQDGEAFSANSRLLSIKGGARQILTGERSALNFLQTLSATATLTAKYVSYLDGSKTRLLDTRKTIPGLRAAQKYAVQCGGGLNHRLGLFDAFLIKENHVRACGGIGPAIAQAKTIAPQAKVEVEVENLQELQEAIDGGADTIMLDNFSPKLVEQAVALNAQRTKLEVSGNITFESLQTLAKTGVDYISSGALTKNIAALDLSLLFD